MLRSSVIRLPQRWRMKDETKYRGRRLLSMPQKPLFRDARDPKGSDYTGRFKDVGPDFARVWVSLGGKMRRRRTGRDKDYNDKRYYWRPLPVATQRLYMSRFRQIDHSNAHAIPYRLHKTTYEIAKKFVGIENERAGPRVLYGARYAFPAKRDWEFRVF